MFEMLLIEPFRNILSCFGDPVSEFTYRCELIDEAINATMRIQAIQGRGYLYEAQTILQSPPHGIHELERLSS